MLAVGVPLAGLAFWIARLEWEAADADWLHQAVWLLLWLSFIEGLYCYLEAARSAAPFQTRLSLPLAAIVILLSPLSTVAETSAEWAMNRLLYAPGYSDVRFFGPLRGVIDTTAYAAATAMTDDPLSPFARDVLGWQDERNSFALVQCASMVGNVLWAVCAMALGASRRANERLPLLAPALRIAALQAATAPLFTLGFFYLTGGTGLNAWAGLFTILLGSIEAGGQVPVWIRLIGVIIFYFLPVGIVAWRIRGESPPGPIPRHRLRGDLPPGRPAWRPAGLLLGLTVVLVAVWGGNLHEAPWGWTWESAWLGAWLLYLGVCIGNGTTSSRFAALAFTWPLAIAGTVVQVGSQWLFPMLLDSGAEPPHLEFFGWITGQIRIITPGAVPSPGILAAAFAGNAAWAVLLCVLSLAFVRKRHFRLFEITRLGALQAASAPNALCAFMVLTIITRDRALPGVPRYDAWHGWTYLTRAVLNAGLGGEAAPLWLRSVAVLGLIGLPAATALALAWCVRSRDRIG